MQAITSLFYLANKIIGMINSIRKQVFLTLFATFSISALFSVLIFWYYDVKKEKLLQADKKVDSIRFMLLEDINLMHQFFETETLNPAFFKSGRSYILQKHFRSIANIKTYLLDPSLVSTFSSEDFKTTFSGLKQNLEKYDFNSRSIIKKIHIRGFKDHGIEGKMRVFAHLLENEASELNRIDVLQLRRHEKDYILRQEDSYLKKHAELVKRIEGKIKQNNNIQKERKTGLLNLINNYSIAFRQVASLEKEIGIKSREGIKRKIDITIANIELYTKTIHVLTQENQEKKLQFLRLSAFLAWGFFLLVCFLSAIYFSKLASRNVTFLSHKIDSFVGSNFTKPSVLPYKETPVNEIEKLSNNFAIMELQIIKQISDLKETNKDLQLLLKRTSSDFIPPLHLIKNISMKANKSNNPADVKKDFETINDSCNTLIEIVDGLGFVNEIKTNEYPYEIIDFSELFDSIFHEHRQGVNQNEIIFSVQISCNSQFYSNKKLLKTIFKNLIDNAVKNRIRRTSFSFVKVFILEDPKDFLKVKVEDNGRGIREEIKSKIFDIFSSTENNNSASELGLYIVKNALQKLNGAITFESKEGQGSTFTVVLPSMKLNKNATERYKQHQEYTEQISEADVELNYL